MMRMTLREKLWASREETVKRMKKKIRTDMRNTMMRRVNNRLLARTKSNIRKVPFKKKKMSIRSMMMSKTMIKTKMSRTRYRLKPKLKKTKKKLVNNSSLTTHKNKRLKTMPNSSVWTLTLPSIANFYT